MADDELTSPDWKLAADRLNDVGVFADEEQKFPGLSAIRQQMAQFESRVRSQGYRGKALSIAEVAPPRDGVAFVVFDRDRLGNDPLTAIATWLQDHSSRWRRRVDAGDHVEQARNNPRQRDEA